MSPVILHLNLTKKWFNAHLNGKNEEYRAITPYWCSRLLLWYGEPKKATYWENYLAVEDLQLLIKWGVVTFKPIDVTIYS